MGPEERRVTLMPESLFAAERQPTRLPGSCAVTLLLLVSTAGICSADWVETRSKLDQAFRVELERLATVCRSVDLERQAQTTSEWCFQRDPGRQYLFLMPSILSPPADTEPLVVRQWYSKWMEHRRAYADDLFGVAEQAVQEGNATASYQLLHEVLREDPEHKAAARVLGKQVSARGLLLKPRTGRRREPTWGWQGGRYWLLESPHFSIRTDTSPQAAVSLARQLEELHTVWQQLFFEHWSDSAALAARFAGPARPLGKPAKHRVVLFRNQAEYREKLRQFEPLIDASVGYYMRKRRTAFFFDGAADETGTRFHEVTHQLFQETELAAPDAGESWNFWVLEGIAVYMESLRRRDGYYTAGGFDADRLQFARARRFSGEFFMDFPEMFALDRQGLQSHEETSKIYSQAAGLTHCLMDHDGGKFRSRFTRFLTAVYARQDNPKSLLHYLDLTVEELSELYVEALQVGDADLSYLSPAAMVRNLSLGRTRITDEGLAAIGRCQGLEWLDLSYTRISDAGLLQLGKQPRLRLLDLERTNVTNESLKVVRRMSELEELDLSGTKVDDTGLQLLVELPKLALLRLADTAITDLSLSSLLAMKQLRQLDVAGTKVTPAALQTLRLDR